MTAPRLYRIGLLGLDLLAKAAENRPLAFNALAVRHHREGGLLYPITPGTVGQALDDAETWLAAEAEAGADPSLAEVRAAQAALTGAPAPTAAAVPTLPSQS